MTARMEIPTTREVLNRVKTKQAGDELDQAQLKLKLELGFILFMICCIELINNEYYLIL